MYIISKRKVKRAVFPLLFLVFLMLVFTSTNYAGWNIYKQAQIKNNRGHYLRFESFNNGYIRIRFGLRNQEEGVFLKNLPVYKVDDNDIHRVTKGNNYKKLKIKVGRYVYWVISNDETPSKELNEFMNGREVVFQYYRDDGEIMEAVFLLDGIKEALKEILN